MPTNPWSRRRISPGTLGGVTRRRIHPAPALAVAAPRTRRRGGMAAALLFVAVFPANVQMALDWRGRTLPQQALAWGRLPLQLPLIAWALRASHDRI
ncbi:MAG: DoxX family protein [Actinomycetes bacterium]